MIGAGSSFWGSAVSYLQGNAKIYDGAFDLDNIVAFNPIERTQAISINCNLKLTAGIATNRIIIDQVFGGRLSVWVDSLRRVQFLWANSLVNRIAGFTSGFSLPENVATSVILTYTGGSNANNVAIYVNNDSKAISILNNALTANIVTAAGGARIGARVATSEYMNGLIRQLEIINRVATPAEIAAASITGSFQGAGVSNADYLLAVEFNQTGTANLTTRPSTPTYNITAVGGAAYTQYL